MAGRAAAPTVRGLLALPPGHDLYVVGDDGAPRGVIVLDVLKGNIPDEHHLSMIVAADVMDPTVLPLATTMTLTEAAGRFAESDLERLPVVDDPVVQRLFDVFAPQVVRLGGYRTVELEVPD